MIMNALLHGPWRMINRKIVASPAAARRLLRDATVVFLYHEVSDQPSLFNQLLDLNVPPAIFDQQLDLMSEFFHFIDPGQLLCGDYPRPAALITFDDGNQGYVRHALPILKAKRIPSVCFLNMGPIQGETCWSGLLAYLRYGQSERTERNGHGEQPLSQTTESQVEQMLACRDREALFERVRIFRGPLMTEADLQAIAQEPLVSLGSHLYNHHNAALLPPERLCQEHWKNQRLLDAHPRGTRLLSYPFGQPKSCYTDNTVHLLRQEGVSAFFSAYPLPNFTSSGPVFHRVPMSASVRTVQGLYEVMLCNYLRARMRLAPVRIS